jgi:nitroreductase
MEFHSVVRRRKMVRNFLARPIDPDTVHRILETGHRGPSAGFSQGYAFLTFEGPEETARFWEAAFPGGEDSRMPGLRNAALIVVPLASKKIYLDRYAEPDKGWTDQDESRWPAPYWTIDTAFATMLILLGAVDEGLGALFFGLFPPEQVPVFLRSLGVPDHYEAIGAIAIGHSAVDTMQSSARRGRRPLSEVVHRGKW